MLAAMVVCAVASSLPGPAEARQNRAHIVIDAASGARLSEHRADKRIHPASLTKMMTLYLVFEEIRKGRLSFSDTVTISRRAASKPPSKLGLRRGSRMTVLNAVRAAAVFSANDVAVALAERVAGSESAFAIKMTRMAKHIGMRNTVFQNASGLTERGHYSTAADMAVLSRRLLLDFPKNYIVFGRTKVSMHGQTRRATNKLLRVRNTIDGLKTGYTSAAGFNLAASEKRGRKRVIVVAVGEPSSKRRDKRVLSLLDDGFERLSKPLGVASAPTPNWRHAARPYGDYALRPLAAEALQRLDSAAAAPTGFGPSYMEPPRRNPRAETQPLFAEAVPPRRTPRADAIREDQIDPLATASTAIAPRRDPRTVETAALAAPSPSATRRDRAPISAAPQRQAPATGFVEQGSWSVQVGAYRRRGLAAERLNNVAALNPPPLAYAHRWVQPASTTGNLFRARFAGLDHQSASDACEWLARRRVDCMLVPPGGWGG